MSERLPESFATGGLVPKGQPVVLGRECFPLLRRDGKPVSDPNPFPRLRLFRWLP